MKLTTSTKFYLLSLILLSICVLSLGNNLKKESRNQKIASETVEKDEKDNQTPENNMDAEKEEEDEISSEANSMSTAPDNLESNSENSRIENVNEEKTDNSETKTKKASEKGKELIIPSINAKPLVTSSKIEVPVTKASLSTVSTEIISNSKVQKIDHTVQSVVAAPSKSDKLVNNALKDELPTKSNKPIKVVAQNSKPKGHNYSNDDRQATPSTPIKSKKSESLAATATGATAIPKIPPKAPLTVTQQQFAGYNSQTTPASISNGVYDMSKHNIDCKEGEALQGFFFKVDSTSEGHFNYKCKSNPSVSTEVYAKTTAPVTIDDKTTLVQGLTSQNISCDEGFGIQKLKLNYEDNQVSYTFTCAKMSNSTCFDFTSNPAEDTVINGVPNLSVFGKISPDVKAKEFIHSMILSTESKPETSSTLKFYYSVRACVFSESPNSDSGAKQTQKPEQSENVNQINLPPFGPERIQKQATVVSKEVPKRNSDSSGKFIGNLTTLIFSLFILVAFS